VTLFGGGPAEHPTSVRWGGDDPLPPGTSKVIISATVTPGNGRHAFGMFGVDHTEVEVDGRPVDGEVALRGNRPVQVTLIGHDPRSTVTPWWTAPGTTRKAAVPAASLSAPAAAVAGTSGTTCGSPTSSDHDGDLIPDALETGGYTVVGDVLVPWRDELAAAGHRKYVSDPTSCATAKDPYTDLEKAFNVMPSGSLREARDPMIAAAPAVGVDLEKLHVTLNDTTGDATIRTRSFSTTNSWSRTLGGKVGVEGKAEGQPEGPPTGSLVVSGEFNFSYTRSGSVTEGTSTTWQEMVNRSTAKAASLNGNVRYHNAGTAPIYDAHPTTSWVLQGEHTMASFRAGPNFRADAIAANETYPTRNAPALSVETINDAGTVDLTVDAEELAALGAQGEVTLDTPQTSGMYGRIVGGRLDPAAGAWGPVLAGVRQASATIILDAGSEVAERHVAARDVRDPDDHTPRITLGEAIDRAFDTEVRDGHRYYRSPSASDPSHTSPLLLDERSILLTMDPSTKKLFDEQMATGVSTMEVELRRGMHIGVKPAASFDDFEQAGFENWSGHDPLAKGFVRPLDVASEPRWTRAGLTPGNRYRIVYRTARPSSGTASSTWVGDAGAQLSYAERNYGTGWASRAIDFTAASSSVVMHGRGQFDDVAVFDLGATRRAGITWVSRHGADLAVPDTVRPGATTALVSTPSDLQDRGGNAALDFILSRAGKPLDLRTAKTTVSGSAVGPWSTSATYKERGHVNVPLRSTGSSVVTVFARTSVCDSCHEPVAILRIDVTAPRPAEVDFWYKQGSSKHMCSFRLRELETPGYRGDFHLVANFKSSSNACRNDDAYYLSFRNLPIGTEMSVFDSPDGKRDDDFFIWENTVETSDGLLYASPRENPPGVHVRERYDDNGLVGKISRLEVKYPGIW